MLRTIALLLLLSGCAMTPEDARQWRLAADILDANPLPDPPRTVICDTRHGRVECPR